MLIYSITAYRTIKHMKLLLFSPALFFCSVLYGQYTPAVSLRDSSVLDRLLLSRPVDLTYTPDQDALSRQVFRTHIHPLFCRIEHSINRRSALPVFFRLGSKEYVDHLEGK